MAESSDKPKRQNGPGRPFLPGQSGNKGGRPRDVDGLRALVREHGPALAERLIRIALGEEKRIECTSMGVPVEVFPTFAESTKATEVLLSYWVGKPAQAIDVKVESGDQLGIAEVRAAARELLTDKSARAALQAAARGERSAAESSTADFMKSETK